MNDTSDGDVAVASDDSDVGGGDVDDITNIIYLWTEIMLGRRRDVPPPSSQTLSISFFDGQVLSHGSCASTEVWTNGMFE